MAFFKKKDSAPPQVKSITETKCTCNACGKIWHYGKQDKVEQQSAKLANAGKAMMVCGSCGCGTPLALLIPDKKVMDLTKCPQCGSKNIKTEEVSYEVTPS